MNGQACNVCKYCAELKAPYERSDGASIYGYCFKNGDKDYSPNMGKGYPIFLPLSCGGTCKDFRRRRADNDLLETVSVLREHKCKRLT